MTVLHIFVRVLMMLDYAAAIGDVFSTNLALSRPGVREGNPVIAFVMRVVGSKWVLVRLAFALLSIVAAANKPDSTAIWLYLAGALVTGYAVFSNVKLYLSKKN